MGAPLFFNVVNLSSGVAIMITLSSDALGALLSIVPPLQPEDKVVMVTAASSVCFICTAGLGFIGGAKIGQ